MKVLHVSSAITWRGGEQQISYLMSGLHDLGIKNFLLCPVSSAFYKRAPKTAQLYTYSKINLDPRVAKQIKQICKQHAIDMIHLHDSHSHTYGVLSSSIYGNKTPMVLSRRVDFPVKPNYFSRWKYNHPAIKRIISISKGVQKILEPAIKDRQRLTIVYSGVDLQRINKPSGILRTEYNIPANEPIIANIASIAPHKDYFTFVDTVKQLLPKIPDAHFLIIGGDGGEREAIRQYIAKNDLAKHITLTGFRTDIADIFSEIDLLLVTSKEEGLCTTIMDSFVAQVPVVATAAGGIPELVLHLQTGLLAPIKNAEKLAKWCEKVLADDQLRTRVIRKAKEHVTQFSAIEMAKNTLAVYSSSLEDSP